MHFDNTLRVTSRRLRRPCRRRTPADCDKIVVDTSVDTNTESTELSRIPVERGTGEGKGRAEEDEGVEGF